MTRAGEDVENFSYDRKALGKDKELAAIWSHYFMNLESMDCLWSC
jgi:hypothetical protein